MTTTKFVLLITCDNAAFEGDGRNLEVARILHACANRLEQRYSMVRLSDVNGNAVGRAEFVTIEVPKPSGRKKATGRFDTREELCAAVWSAYLESPQNQAQIARMCRVSETVVKKILDTKEGMPE